MPYPAWVGKMLAVDRVRSVAGCVNVQWHGAKGSGNPADAAANEVAFAEAQLEADATERGLYVPIGDYYKTTGLAITREKMAIIGDVGSTIHVTGAGPILSIDGGAGPIAGVPCWQWHVENLILIGNAAATRGLWVRNAHQGYLANVQIEDCTETAAYLETATSNLFVNFACTVNRHFFAIQPDAGILLTKRPGDPPGNTSVMNAFLNPIIEGLTLSANGYGLYIIDGSTNAFLGGTFEGNKREVRIDAEGFFNHLIGTTLVKNASTVYDILCAGAGNIFENAYSQHDVTWDVGARANSLVKGFYSANITNLSAFEQLYDHPVFATTAVLTDAVTVNPLDRRYFDQNINAWSSA